jgi:hypothetical protein
MQRTQPLTCLKSPNLLTIKNVNYLTSTILVCGRIVHRSRVDPRKEYESCGTALSNVKTFASQRNK